MLLLGDKELTIEKARLCLFDNEPVQVSEAALQSVRDNYNFLLRFSTEKVIYGINTGFGPMAQYKINDEDRRQLQYNLIRSHCSGMGQPLSPLFCKAAMLARLNTLLLARSGVHENLVLLLQDMLNLNIVPVVYEHGGVGASGDLVQLAHLALTVIGEGKVYYNGEIRNTAEVFAEVKLQPVQIYIREGIALMNGTSYMTGIGIVNCIYASQLLEHSISISSWLNELIGSYDDYFSSALNEAKRHPGQMQVASSIRERLKESTLVRSRGEHLYKAIDTQRFEDHNKIQEYYSIRCTPQILGPVWDTIQAAVVVLENELNSVNDNPVIDHELGNVFHGGNFHGDYVSLEMDKLKTVSTRVAMLLERQLNFLMNDKLNGILPPFLNKGVLGLNFGLQGIQFTATSTTAECQTLSFPMYVHSIPNNNDNQDIVSMGTNAALMCNKVIENTFEVTSVMYMALIQATGILRLEGKLSIANETLRKELEEAFQPFQSDQPKYEDLSFIKKRIKTGAKHKKVNSIV